MSDTKITVTSTISTEEKPVVVKEESATVERIPTPDIISEPPAPVAAKVTTVTEKSTSKASSSQLSPKMSSSQTTTRTTKTSVGRSSDYESTIGQLTRDYRGTSPAVLEGIASHPILYSKTFDSKIGRQKLSARSKKILRDTSDLAIVAPGLKNLLEVGYNLIVLLQSSKLLLCCVGLSWFGTECSTIQGKTILLHGFQFCRCIAIGYF